MRLLHVATPGTRLPTPANADRLALTLAQSPVVGTDRGALRQELAQAPTGDWCSEVFWLLPAEQWQLLASEMGQQQVQVNLHVAPFAESWPSVQVRRERAAAGMAAYGWARGFLSRLLGLCGSGLQVQVVAGAAAPVMPVTRAESAVVQKISAAAGSNVRLQHLLARRLEPIDDELRQLPTGLPEEAVHLSRLLSRSGANPVVELVATLLDLPSSEVTESVSTPPRQLTYKEQQLAIENMTAMLAEEAARFDRLQKLAIGEPPQRAPRLARPSFLARPARTQLEATVDGFDPIHYLVLNPDVDQARRDPLEHYAVVGKGVRMSQIRLKERPAS